MSPSATKPPPVPDQRFSGPSDSSPTQPYEKGQIVIVKEGDTVERLARRIYGRVDDGILALVQKHNPSIRNLNFILPGQDLVFPPLE